MTPKEFVEAYLFDAVKNQVETGVPLLVTLSQAALESGWGKYAKGNNFFGIKAFGWSGETVDSRTVEFIEDKPVSITAKFRKYNSPAESFKDHAELLLRKYRKAFEFSDPVRFVRSMQNDHGYKYATDPNYAEKIGKLVERIKLIIINMEKL